MQAIIFIMLKIRVPVHPKIHFDNDYQNQKVAFTGAKIDENQIQKKQAFDAC